MDLQIEVTVGGIEEEDGGEHMGKQDKPGEIMERDWERGGHTAGLYRILTCIPIFI